MMALKNDIAGLGHLGPPKTWEDPGGVGLTLAYDCPVGIRVTVANLRGKKSCAPLYSDQWQWGLLRPSMVLFCLAYRVSLFFTVLRA
jgi:hypothetical protein